MGDDIVARLELKRGRLQPGVYPPRAESLEGFVYLPKAPTLSMNDQPVS
jgi:hypothetical protein